MVSEYGYEKRKDHRTESQTEVKIKYFTLATLFNDCSTSCVLCFVYVEHIGSKQSQGRKGSTVHTLLGKWSMSMVIMALAFNNNCIIYYHIDAQWSIGLEWYYIFTFNITYNTSHCVSLYFFISQIDEKFFQFKIRFGVVWFKYFR